MSVACGDLIEALEECHRLPYTQRMFGACNNPKDALNKCLRAERLDRNKENYRRAAEKRKAIEKRWKEMEEEEYGPNGVLKSVVGKPAPQNDKS
jgi:COX assembly protein 2